MDAIANTLDALRSLHRVRLIQASEEGYSVERLPKGIYGFTYAPGLDQMPLFGKKGFHSFEIHKADNGSVHLIGYVSSADHEALGANREGARIQLYPDPWESATELVSVEASRVVIPKRAPSREDGNPITFTL